MSIGTMLFNPFTGKPRDPRDIASDPRGVLVWDGEEPLRAATPAPQAQLAEGAVSEPVINNLRRLLNELRAPYGSALLYDRKAQELRDAIDALELTPQVPSEPAPIVAQGVTIVDEAMALAHEYAHRLGFFALGVQGVPLASEAKEALRAYLTAAITKLPTGEAKGAA